MNTTRLLSKTLNPQTQNTTLIRTYYTNRNQIPTLYSKISPLGDPKISVVPELESWVENGNKVRVAELQRIIHDLRKRKRFSQALEVSEWMNKKGVCLFSPSECAVQLDLIGRVHGFVTAENYFNDLKDHEKNEKTYGALLNCYVRQREINKSLSHLQKMKELGFASSSLCYNDLMCLYTNVGQHENVPYVLAEMKENYVRPDNFSYRLCINSYGARLDIKGMEKTLTEMEQQPHIVMDWNTYAVAANFYIKAGLREKAVDALKRSEQILDEKDGTGFNHLISLYASLGNKAEVLRLWVLEKDACKRCLNKDYVNMLESLVRLGELDDAEEVFKEWESCDNCYDIRIPNILVIGYCRKGLYDRAESMLKTLVDERKTTPPNTWGEVAAGYLEKGEMLKAFNCLKVAVSLCTEGKGWKANPEVVAGILNWLKDEGRSEDLEAFTASLKSSKVKNLKACFSCLKGNEDNGKIAKGEKSMA